MRIRNVIPQPCNRRCRGPCLAQQGARRRALATLETVLSFPVLIALAAMILAIGSASVQKCDVVIQARHEAWAQRTNSPTREFLERELGKGLLQGTAESPVRLPPGLRSMDQESTATAHARHGLIVGPWDDPKAGFEGKNSDYSPHSRPLENIARSSGSGVLALFNQQGESSFSELRNILGTGDGSLDPAVQALVHIHQEFDPLKSGLEAFEKLVDTLDKSIDKAMSAADSGTEKAEQGLNTLGNAIQSGGKLIGGVGGKAVEGLGKMLSGGAESLKDARDKIKIVKEGIAAFRELMAMGIKAGQGLADALNGGPGPAAYSDDSIEKLASRASEIENLWKELKKAMDELGIDWP